jgi:hypothetical protein
MQRRKQGEFRGKNCQSAQNSGLIIAGERVPGGPL